MSRVSNLFLAGILAVAVIAPASAGVIYTGTGGPIADNASQTFDIFVADHGLPVDGNFSLNITHTWIGDLIVWVEHVNTGATADLFYRVGIPPGAPFGDSSDLNGVYRFSDELFPGDLWAAAAAASPIETIPGGDYIATTDGGAPTSMDQFGAEDIYGTWRLHINDAAGNDVGYLTEWKVELETATGTEVIPEPATMALLGLGVAGLLARRIRRTR